MGVTRGMVAALFVSCLFWAALITVVVNLFL